MRAGRVQARGRGNRLVLPGRTVTLRVCGQRLEVTGNNAQVVIAHELRGVVEGLGHRPVHHGVLVAPGLEEPDDLGLAPAAKPGVVVIAQAGRVPAIEQGTGEEWRTRFIESLLVEGQAPWRMAAAAVARPWTI